jgi:hypothetical protein
VCWKWRKVVCDAAPGAQLREFLDTQQYSTAGILKYERVFGDGFVSTGGVDTTRARPAAWARRRPRVCRAHARISMRQ